MIQIEFMVEKESDMKRNEFEALALLRKQAKEMRASGKWMLNTTLAQQHSMRNRCKRSQETSIPISVNFEPRDLNASTLEI